MASRVLEGIQKAIDNIGKLPEVLYTHEEGSFHSKQADDCYEDKHIKHIMTRGHASHAERAIRTIKDMIYKRIDKVPGAKWYSSEILSNALVTYNCRIKHSGTSMTPADTRKPENRFDVKTNLDMHRVKRRRYKDVNVGDDVRVYTPKRKTFKKKGLAYGVKIHIRL